MFDFRKLDYWLSYHIRLLKFHHCIKFGAENFNDSEFMPQNKIQNGGRRHLEFTSGVYFWHCRIIITFRFSRWRPSAMLDFLKADFWAMHRTRLLIFHHCTKFCAKNVDRHQNYGPKSKSKMAAVRHLENDASSYRTTHEVFSMIWLEMPIDAPQFSVFVVIGHHHRSPKGTSLAGTALTCQFWYRSVRWCDLCARWRNQKRKKGEERNLLWQTVCSPRPPTLTQRHVVLPAGWSSGGSSKFQVSSKSVERLNGFRDVGSKFAISYTSTQFKLNSIYWYMAAVKLDWTNTENT